MSLRVPLMATYDGTPIREHPNPMVRDFARFYVPGGLTRASDLMRLLDNLERFFRKTNQVDALRMLTSINFSKIKAKEKGGLYEVEVPDDDVLLDE